MNVQAIIRLTFGSPKTQSVNRHVTVQNTTVEALRKRLESNPDFKVISVREL